MKNINPSKFILIVDDDSTMQLLLQGMVQKAGYKAVIAENGEKALQFLDVGGENIDVILLDRQMADMDGMEVVTKVKENENCSRVPIIMQSGSKKPEDIKQAIDAGVFYYLTKPFKIETLESVLEYAILQSGLRSILQDRHAKGYTPANLIHSASFEFSGVEDARRLAILLASLFPEPMRVFPGLLGTLMNAVEHGSLGLGYDKKTEMLQAGDYLDAVEELEAKNDKIVEAQFIQKDGRLSVRITDQGDGFDWKQQTKFKEERESFSHGYGILKALKAFDEVKYNTAGNQVMLSILQDKN